MQIAELIFMSLRPNNKHLYILIAFSIMFFTNLAGQAQEKTPVNGMPEDWIIGLHTGFYFANDYTASYYNGSESNENSISFVLDNKYRENEILKHFDATSYVYDESDLPQNMTYDPNINIGFLARNNINKQWGVFVSFNYVKLTAKGSFTLEFDPDEIATQADRRVFDIYGKEERTNIDIGVHRQFNHISPNLTYFGEIGVNINNTKVAKSAIDFGDGLNYSIVDRYGPNTNYVPNTNQQKDDFRLGGIGYGIFGNMGMKLLFSSKLSIDIGINTYVKTINLEQYESFTLHYAPYARIMYNGFFDFI